MKKIKNLADLRSMKDGLQSKIDLREKSNNPEDLIQVKIAMATCGIASGAKEVMDYMMEESDRRNVPMVITQTGCMGYCHAEPTLEIKVPGREPLVFGHVDKAKVDEIFDKYIKNNELIEGIIPVNYDTIG